MNVERWHLEYAGGMMLICIGAAIAGWLGWWAGWASFLTLLGGLTIGYISGAKDAE